MKRDFFKNFKTKHKEGFTRQEIKDFCQLNNFNFEDFCDRIGVVTGVVVEGEFLTYRDDIELAIRLTIEKRDKNIFEFD